MGRAPSSTTNLQDLTPAEAELVLGGRREVVLRYRLHVLPSETTESTTRNVPLLLEGARGRSLHDAPHRGETQSGVCYVPTRGSALEKRRGREEWRGWRGKRERKGARCPATHARRRVFILRALRGETMRNSQGRLGTRFLSGSERTRPRKERRSRTKSYMREVYARFALYQACLIEKGKWSVKGIEGTRLIPANVLSFVLRQPGGRCPSEDKDIASVCVCVAACASPRTSGCARTHARTHARARPLPDRFFVLEALGLRASASYSLRVPRVTFATCRARRTVKGDRAYYRNNPSPTLSSVTLVPFGSIRRRSASCALDRRAYAA